MISLLILNDENQQLNVEFLAFMMCDGIYSPLNPQFIFMFDWREKIDQ